MRDAILKVPEATVRSRLYLARRQLSKWREELIDHALGQSHGAQARSPSLIMLQSIGWIAAHRFLFRDLPTHLLGWPAFLAALIGKFSVQLRSRSLYTVLIID